MTNDRSLATLASRTLSKVALVAGLTAAAFVPAAQAQSTNPVLTITTGSATGTYFQFAEEIRKILPPDVQLEVVPSDGSVQNLRRLIGYEGLSENKYYQLAMVQADVLAQLRSRAADNSVLSTIVDRIQVVMPLYSEEIHAFALAKDDLRSLDDVLNAELTINAGEEKSGTNLTAQWLFEQINETETAVDWTNIQDEMGLPELGGSYELLFSVAGAPSQLGRSIEPESGITLVPIEVPQLYELDNSPYRPATLTPEQYPWLKRDVETMAVDALLVAFAYEEDNPYCGQIEKLTRAIVEGLRVWKDPSNGGHPKWQEVDVNKASNRSDLYVCAERALSRF